MLLLLYCCNPCRYSSPLLRMPTAEHIKQQVVFQNTGPDQVPGVIVMQLHSSWQPDHGTWDDQYKQVGVGACPRLLKEGGRGHGVAWCRALCRCGSGCACMCLCYKEETAQ